jgi:hypothetical protein
LGKNVGVCDGGRSRRGKQYCCDQY